VKAISVRQPWSWALLNGKDVENRSRNILGGHRGERALHAGGQLADAAAFDWVLELTDGVLPQLGLPGRPAPTQLGGVIGVLQVTGTHPADSCGGGCSSWADPTGFHIRHDTTLARALDRVVECPGRLGLFTLPEDVAARVRRQLA
jgi:hypothetical protein